MLYLCLVSIPLVFGRIYGFSTGESGLVYITQTIGSTIGLVFDLYCNRLYIKNVAKRGPEARLYSACAFAFALVRRFARGAQPAAAL